MDSRRPRGSDPSDRKRLAFLPRCKPGPTTKDLIRVVGNPEAMFREVFLDGTWNPVSSCHGLSGRLTLWVHPQGTKQLSSSIARTNKKRASLNEGSKCIPKWGPSLEWVDNLINGSFSTSRKNQYQRFPFFDLLADSDPWAFAESDLVNDWEILAFLSLLWMMGCPHGPLH